MKCDAREALKITLSCGWENDVDDIEFTRAWFSSKNTEIVLNRIILDQFIAVWSWNISRIELLISSEIPLTIWVKMSLFDNLFIVNWNL